MIDEIKIMQYVDGTLPAEEKEAVEKAIENNPEFKKLLKDYQETADVLFNLGKSIKSQPLPNSLKKKLKEINSWKEIYAKKDRPGFFEAIFQKPIRNFIAYPIAAVFIFTLGFQINMFQVRTSTQEVKTAKLQRCLSIRSIARRRRTRRTRRTRRKGAGLRKRDRRRRPSSPVSGQLPGARSDMPIAQRTKCCPGTTARAFGPSPFLAPFPTRS